MIELNIKWLDKETLVERLYEISTNGAHRLDAPDLIKNEINQVTSLSDSEVEQIVSNLVQLSSDFGVDKWKVVSLVDFLSDEEYLKLALHDPGTIKTFCEL
ncbi:MAG: hypothetical protein IBX48_05305 [Thiomicrospira sp.]|uniref:hypothetical protein n=1 Tax=Thiomicrospira sp. TaxID=935 RepID=UPI001A091C91|nr:hypothetical protein [Thiomicrospira sp.]MBE0493740.1 hypothetical protein [Thiomicrospira sp.]